MIRKRAGIAQLVERHLAKVEVASSSLVSRSIFFVLHFLPESPEIRCDSASCPVRRWYIMG